MVPRLVFSSVAWASANIACASSRCETRSRFSSTASNAPLATLSPLRTFSSRITPVMRGVMLACSRGKMVAGAFNVACTAPVSAMAVFTATMALGLTGSSSLWPPQPTTAIQQITKRGFIVLGRPPRRRGRLRIGKALCSNWRGLAATVFGPPQHRAQDLRRPDSEAAIGAGCLHTI